MFAAVYVPTFALQALLRNEPELRERPVALVEAAGANLAKAIILECTRAAEANDVCAGLTAPQAQARCRKLVLKARVPPAEQRATEILLQTAYTFSPHIEHTATGVCTIDLRGLNFGGNEGNETRVTFAAQQSFGFQKEQENAARIHDWAETIVAALRQFGLESRVGLASAPNIALLAARAAHPVLLVERVNEFFATLPLAALEPASPLYDILQRWGIHTAGALLALGKEAIAARLGAEALELFHQADAEIIRPLNIISPPETFEEQMEFEVHVETVEPLLFALRRFVEQLTSRISLAYRVVAEFRLTLGLETGAPYERTFTVPAPTANVETLFRMLHTHLENLRTAAPITFLRLSARPAREERQQFHLFESVLRDPNHFHETLARLIALLSSQRVGTPIKSGPGLNLLEMQTPQFECSRSSAGDHLELGVRARGLCLRRFRSPSPVAVAMQQGKPVELRGSTFHGKLRQPCRGPFAQGTHCVDPAPSQIEWDVETNDGTLLRLAQRSDGWFVEGVYD